MHNIANPYVLALLAGIALLVVVILRFAISRLCPLPV